jgi:hypothetical protein
MKQSRFVASIFIVSLAFGTCVLGYSQDNQDKQKDKHEDQSKHQDLHGQQKQMERSQDQEHQQQDVQRRAWQERRANHFEFEHRSWQQRGGYQGYRIPDDYFHVHYGNGHTFRIYSLPFVYEGGNPRFQYEGYWFTMMDPYPEDWGGAWYQTDDVYVDYQNDGYYLFNRSYPNRPGIAINITPESGGSVPGVSR